MLSADDAADLQALMQVRSAPAGTPLLYAGAPGDSLLLLLAGRAKVFTTAADGREVPLAIAGPGDHVNLGVKRPGQLSRFRYGAPGARRPIGPNNDCLHLAGLPVPDLPGS
jgi:Cyclic nucleotide-binding domain